MEQVAVEQDAVEQVAVEQVAVEASRAALGRSVTVLLAAKWELLGATTPLCIGVFVATLPWFDVAPLGRGCWVVFEGVLGAPMSCGTLRPASGAP